MWHYTSIDLEACLIILFRVRKLRHWRVFWSALALWLYLSGSCKWLTLPQIRPLQELQNVLQADINLLCLCLEQIETAWLWLACLLHQPDVSCKERAQAECCAHEHKQLLFLSKHWKNNLVCACNKNKDVKLVESLSSLYLSSKNVEFGRISTCSVIFRILRLRFLEAFEDAEVL